MLKPGLNKIAPRHTDFSLLHTFGALNFDPQGLPTSFSLYDDRPIPNQDMPDDRFSPALPPLPMGCTGETVTFNAGIQDGKLFNPQFTYIHTPPGDSGGRDIRAAMKCAQTIGLQDNTGATGFKRGDYYNCYGAGKIDDFDAARIALWLNQGEKRCVIIGTFWYWGISPQNPLPTPSYNASDATLHCYLVVGWDGDNLLVIPWIGQFVGDNGVFKMPREIYNKLMAQPWTGAFTQAKNPSDTSPIPLGFQVYLDHFIYWFKNLLYGFTH